MKKAIILGATGMVGAALLEQLLASDDYSEIVIFVRRKSGITHSKLTEYVVDFDRPEDWKALVSGDVLFSALGTTLAVAGSKENQYKVDFTYQYVFAKTAFENGVSDYVLVSSAGASAKAATFYLKMKGELDEAVQQLKFRSVSILRPGQLYGNRKENRVAEKMAIQFMFGLNKIGLFRKYRPIHASEVARAMQKMALEQKNQIITLDELFLKQ